MTLYVITKRIPARTKSIYAKWVKREFLVYGDNYRRARSGLRKKMDICHLCRRKFLDGEQFALACFEGVGNRVLCQPCADELLSHPIEAESLKS